MFTGIIEEIGTIKALQLSDFGTITIRAKKVLDGICLGDSIAVNGVCLTVTSFTVDTFTVDVMAQTVRSTNLGSLKKDDKVNLERALSLKTRLGGHIVSGHIDETGTILSFRSEKNAIWITIRCSCNFMKYIVKKGSIAIDGISLTVANVEKEYFQVSVIPHTRNETTLLQKKIGQSVNLEFDILAKYTERFLNALPEEEKTQNKLNIDFLQKCGF